MFNFAKAMRRATRLTRAGRVGSATETVRRAISGAMSKTLVASMSPFSSRPPAHAKAATKPHKATAKPTPRPATLTPARRRAAIVQHLPASVSGPSPAAAKASPASAPVKPEPATYLERTHSCSSGTRDFKLYLPARHPGGPKGLIVMLHGCTQNPDDFAAGTNMNVIAQRHGLAVAYPEQTRGHNGASCWNWFTPSNQSRGRGEPAILAGLAEGLMQEFELGRTRVFVAGLSAGGAMAVILADTYPDVFSAAGVHSGLPRGSARSVMSAMTAMNNGGTAAVSSASQRRLAAKTSEKARRIIFQGDADTTVHPSNAPQIVIGAVGDRKPSQVSPKSAAGRHYIRSDYVLPDGTVDVELWQIKGAGHAWSGGKPGGTFTDTKGPDASAEMVRFFLTQTG